MKIDSIRYFLLFLWSVFCWSVLVKKCCSDNFQRWALYHYHYHYYYYWQLIPYICSWDTRVGCFQSILAHLVFFNLLSIREKQVCRWEWHWKRLESGLNGSTKVTAAEAESAKHQGLLVLGLGHFQFSALTIYIYICNFLKQKRGKTPAALVSSECRGRALVGSFPSTSQGLVQMGGAALLRTAVWGHCCPGKAVRRPWFADPDSTLNSWGGA